MSILLNHLDRELSACLERHDIPGASVAIGIGDRTVTAAQGALNMDTGVSVTPDSVFMVGSTTKVMTATVLLQLVDEGLVYLEEPAATYLPEVKIGPGPIDEAITVGMLLNHTSGIDGDFFIDTGWNEDALGKLAGSLSEIDYLHPPGVMRSYCNTAYCLVGRIIEKICGDDFGTVLTKRFLCPLGIRDAVYRPQEFLRFRSAIGHVMNHSTGSLELSKESAGPYGQLPAGTVLSMSAPSLLEVGRFHLRQGLAPGGQRLLSMDAVSEMQRPLTSVVPDMPACQVWAVTKFGDKNLFNHFGGTAGQNAWLGIQPDADLAIAVLANSMTGAFQINEDLVARLLEDLAGLKPEIHEEKEPPTSENVITDQFTGRYTRYAMDIVISARGDELYVDVEDRDDELVLGNQDSYRLIPVEKNKFLVEGQELIPGPLPIEFFFEKNGSFTTLMFFGRAHRLKAHQ